MYNGSLTGNGAAVVKEPDEPEPVPEEWITGLGEGPLGLGGLMRVGADPQDSMSLPRAAALAARGPAASFPELSVVRTPGGARGAGDLNVGSGAVEATRERLLFPSLLQDVTYEATSELRFGPSKSACMSPYLTFNPAAVAICATMTAWSVVSLPLNKHKWVWINNPTTNCNETISTAKAKNQYYVLSQSTGSREWSSQV